MDAHRQASWRSIQGWKVHLVLIGSVVGFLMVDALITEWLWESGAEEYWRHKHMSFIGMYLVTVPWYILQTGFLPWFPWWPLAWLTAWGAAVVVVRTTRPLVLPVRILYAVLFALTFSGFAAAGWSTIGM